MPVSRALLWSLAASFATSTLLQIIDWANLVAQPPNIPESANLVDRILAQIPYRHDIWPVFFGTNFLLGLGFVALSLLGSTLEAQVPRSNERSSLLKGTFISGGLLGAAGQLVVLGSVKASIDIPYCDCGFKEQEIVSQVWALMVTQSVGDLLVGVAILLAAAGLALSGTLFAEQIGERSKMLAWAVAVVLIIYLIVRFATLSEDLGMVLGIVTTGILVPVWAIWFGSALGSRDARRT
jgi:hypothetical protein